MNGKMIEDLASPTRLVILSFSPFLLPYTSSKNTVRDTFSLTSRKISALISSGFDRKRIFSDSVQRETIIAKPELPEGGL